MNEKTDKKYYEMHDEVYQKLEAKGFFSWDKHDSAEALLDTTMNKTLKELMDASENSLSKMKVLDLGTGTGNCALFCASHGAQATGVDAALTAINMAKKNAESLKLTVNFLVADILNLKLNQKFNLITDSSLLHCLVGSEDRTNFYSTAKNHLTSNGLLFIHTMTESSDMRKMIDPKFFHFENEVLWSLGMKDIEKGRKEINGQSYFPHRTILSEENLLAETAKHSFKLLHKEVFTQVELPDTFVGLFQL